MPSDIYIKTTAGGWSTAAKAIQIKVSTTLWKPAKALYLKFDVSGWTKVWPLSGPFATDFPYVVSTASGSTHLTSANVRRVGTSLFGRFNTTDWNSNGWGTLAYTYYWKSYSYSAAGETIGETTISSGSFVAPSQQIILGTGQDQKHLSFRIRGTSTVNSLYYGEAESGDSPDGRIYIAKNKPELLATGYPAIQVGSKGTSLTAIPNVGDVLTYSNTWDPASDKSIQSSRTITRWYRKTTFPSLVSDARSAGGGYLDTTGLSSIGTGLTYTVTNLDIGNYIYCNQEVFNSGSDFDFAGWKYDQATQVPPQEGFGRKVGEACYNKVLGAVPVGTALTVVTTRDRASYTHTASNNGTWTNTPIVSYRYQWYLETQTSGSSYTYSPITGATSSTYNASVYQPSGSTSYRIVPVVWATNANGESNSGYALKNSSGIDIASTLGGISGSTSTVFYREPIINTFTITGGENKFTYVSDYVAYDPAYTAIISWTGTATGSLGVTSSSSTQTSPYLAPGTYNFALTITNTGSSGGSYSKALTRSNITITATAPYSFTFGSLNPLYVGTNGHIHFDSGYALSAPSTGKSLAIYLADLIQGQPTADTIGLKYWSDASTYVVQFKGYGYANPLQNVAGYALDYQVKFNIANSYADVSIIRKGTNVPQPTYIPGMYLNTQKWIPGVNGLPTYTVPTDLTDEGDTANAYTYRLNFNGTQGSLSVIPWASRPAGKQYRIPDSIMVSAQPINATNNTALTTGGSLDDGWTKLTPNANEYVKSTITAGTATASPTTLSIPFTTGGADYSTYSYDLRTTSFSGSIAASATGQTSNPIVIPGGLVPSTTYYLTLTPTNSMGQNGNANFSTTSTSAAPKAAGTKKIIPLGITVTSASTIAYVSTNGFIGLNSDPGTVITIPITGRYLNILQGDLQQTALYTTVTSTTYSIRYQGRLLSDATQTVDYEIKFTFGSTSAEAYIITNNLTSIPVSDTVLFVNNVGVNTWSTLNNSSMTATAATQVPNPANVDDARTAITLTASASNLITSPSYGTATSASGGFTASISTAANPSGGTYAAFSVTPAGTSYTVNSSTGAVSVTGLAASTSATVTSSYTLSGYNTAYPQVTGTSSAAGGSIPTGGIVSIGTNTGNYSVGSIITYSTSGWSGSPTSYVLQLHNGTNPVLTSDPQRGSTTLSSATYTIAPGDVPNYFKAWATASNLAGTSTQASSTQVGPATAPAVAAPGIPTFVTSSYSGSGTSYSASITWAAGVGGTPSSYTVCAFQSNGNPGSNGWIALSPNCETKTSTSTSRNSTRSDTTWIQYRITATNAGGTSGELIVSV